MKNFRDRCQNYISRVHKIRLENNVFRIFYQFLFFRTLMANILVVWHTFFGWFVKTAFFAFRGHFWRKNKLIENCTTSSCTKGGFWVKLLFGICASHPRNPSDGKCGCIKRTFSVGLLKLDLSCPEDTIGEKHLSKYLSYSSFLDCQQKFLACLGESSLVEKNSFQYLTLSYWLSGYGSGGNFWRKNIFADRKFLPLISNFQLMILGLLAKNGKGHQSCNLRVQWKFLPKDYSWEKKIIFFRNAAEIARTFNWNFCHGCQIFLPRVQKKKLLREQKLEKKKYSIHFSSLREKFESFAKVFSIAFRTAFQLPIPGKIFLEMWCICVVSRT